jgi:hypothetical protein
VAIALAEAEARVSDLKMELKASKSVICHEKGWSPKFVDRTAKKAFQLIE